MPLFLKQRITYEIAKVFECLAWGDQEQADIHLMKAQTLYMIATLPRCNN